MFPFRFPPRTRRRDEHGDQRAEPWPQARVHHAPMAGQDLTVLLYPIRFSGFGASRVRHDEAIEQQRC